MTRIAIADDHRLVRSGIRRFLETCPDLDVAGFDLLILDVNMDGDRATSRVISMKAALHRSRIIVGILTTRSVEIL